MRVILAQRMIHTFSELVEQIHFWSSIIDHTGMNGHIFWVFSTEFLLGTYICIAADISLSFIRRLRI